MKNKNAHNKMTFNKSVVTELNNSELATIQGGSTGVLCDILGDMIKDLTTYPLV